MFLPYAERARGLSVLVGLGTISAILIVSACSSNGDNVAEPQAQTSAPTTAEFVPNADPDVAAAEAAVFADVLAKVDVLPAWDDQAKIVGFAYLDCSSMLKKAVSGPELRAQLEKLYAPGDGADPSLLPMMTAIADAAVVHLCPEAAPIWHATANKPVPGKGTTSTLPASLPRPEGEAKYLTTLGEDQFTADIDERELLTYGDLVCDDLAAGGDWTSAMTALESTGLSVAARTAVSNAAAEFLCAEYYEQFKA